MHTESTVKLIALFLLLQLSVFAQRRPISLFTENIGQITNQDGKANNNVKYLLNTRGLNVQLRSGGFSYDIYESDNKKVDTNGSKSILRGKEQLPKFHRIDINFEGSNLAHGILEEGKSPGYSNYYNLPHNKSGVTHVYGYEKVTYMNLYNGIDVVFFVPNDTLKAVEYNFVVHPGGNVSDIKLRFKGCRTELHDNRIRMKTRFGTMEETIPVSWIEDKGERKDAEVRYKKLGTGLYGFEATRALGEGTLIIDPVPVRIWGTFYGGSREEFLLSLEKDSAGNAIISGKTASKDFIASTGAHQGTYGSPYIDHIILFDGFIAKFDGEGNRLWSTYYGGERDDAVNDIAIASGDAIAFCGNTISAGNISTPGSFKESKSGSYDEMFLGLLDTDGIRIWCSYYGDDTGRNFMNAIAVDGNDNIYVGGATAATGYIATDNAFKSTPPESVHDFDGFIAKFSLEGQRLLGTYYGGGKSDHITDLSIDGQGNVIAGGYTLSTTGIAAENAYQEVLNEVPGSSMSNDGFLVSFSPEGIRNWGTYFGGEQTDKILKIKIEGNFVYVVGETASPGLATPEGFTTVFPDSSSPHFVAKYDMSSHQKVWYSYSVAKITDIEVNPQSEIYLVGESNFFASDIATPGAFNPNNNNFISYIRKINTNCQIIWGTYLGNHGFIQQPFVRFVADDLFYIAGTAWLTSGLESGLISGNSYQDVNNGGHDGYVNKFKDCITATLATSNSPVCIGGSIVLQASGGTAYAWSGPNGFTSELQNPVIPLASTEHAGVYTCHISGTTGCDGASSTSIVIGDTLAPVPVLAALPQLNGNCNTIITTIPTAHDACSGLLSATTMDPLQYKLPGTYTVHWMYKDSSGNISMQEQTIVINGPAAPNAASPQVFCISQNATVGAIAVSGQDIKWYDTSGTMLTPSTALQDGVTYFASQTTNGCESLKTPVMITIVEPAAPVGAPHQRFCNSQGPTVSDILTDTQNITWFASPTDTIPLSGDTLLFNGVTYYGAAVIMGCFSVARLAVTAEVINSLPVYDHTEIVCDILDDGTETIDLTAFEQYMIAEGINATYAYYSSRQAAQQELGEGLIANPKESKVLVGTTLIYVRVVSAVGCSAVAELSISLVSPPTISIPDTVVFCRGGAITLDAGAGHTSYEWSNGTSGQFSTITRQGDYWVKVSALHGNKVCTTVREFYVSEFDKAVIERIQIKDWTDKDNVIAILANGQGNYEYSIDGVNYQDSPTFSGLGAGAYTVFIRELNGCGTVSKDVYLLMYPRFFTPNGDGHNDRWGITFAHLEPDLVVSIFDRYGKLITCFTGDGYWDGRFQGRELPSGDYWFLATRGDGEQLRAHFSLMR